jgi:hypothetical protein
VAAKAEAVANRKRTAKADEQIERLKAQGEPAEPADVTMPVATEKPPAATAEAPTTDQDHDAEDLRIVLRDDIRTIYVGLPNDKARIDTRKALMLGGNINAIDKMNDIAGLKDLLAKIRKRAGA